MVRRNPLFIIYYTGELGYDGPLYDGFLHMTDDMLGPSLMHIKYSSYVYDGFCIWRTNFPGPIESVISKFTCITLIMWLFGRRWHLIALKIIKDTISYGGKPAFFQLFFHLMRGCSFGLWAAQLSEIYPNITAVTAVLLFEPWQIGHPI